MALLVQKFGGTSVGNLERIHHVAAKIIQARQQGHQVAVVVSAMSGETDRLIKLAEALTPYPIPREYDALVSTGEQVSIALLAMALNAKNCPAKSYNAQQAKIITDNNHTKAKIEKIETTAILRDLAENKVVIVAGFQGVNAHGDITTLGRGGSDTTAVALAVALKAQECQIYTDVGGVYTTDPHLIPEAKLLPLISFEEMLEMSNLGAKVLQSRSVEVAYENNMPIRVLSTFTDSPGTLVTSAEHVSKRSLSGIAFSREEAIFSLSGIPQHTNIESHIAGIIDNASIEIDMMTQAAAHSGLDFTFSVNHRDFHKTLPIIEQLSKELGATPTTNAQVAKVSLIGSGLHAQTGATAKLLQALTKAGINILMMNSSDLKISVIVEKEYLEAGVRAIHDAFEFHSLIDVNVA